MKLSCFTVRSVLLIAAGSLLLAAPARGRTVRQASENGSWVAEMDFNGDPLHPAIGSFILKDHTGGTRWASRQFGQNACWIANDGQTVAGWRGSGDEGLPGLLSFFGPKGNILRKLPVTGFSGGGFTGAGNLFICLANGLGIAAFDRAGRLKWQVPSGSQYFFNRDGSRLAVVRKERLTVYLEGSLQGDIDLEAPYLKSAGFDPSGNTLEVSTDEAEMTYDAKSLRLVARSEKPPLVPKRQRRAPGSPKAGTTSWPLDPIDSAHSVGNGWGEYQNYSYTTPPDPSSGYFHPGIDVMALDTSGVPVYAVAHGWIKAWLSTGGTYYWRFAIADTNSDFADSCDGWLYAHIDAARSHASVGDEVWPGDLIGYLVQWPVTGFDHCHFARIRDAGAVWGNAGADWVFQDDPFNWLAPGDDAEPPVIEPALTGSMFAFCLNNTSDYLAPGNLSGDVDIIARIYDRFGQAIQYYPEWEKLNPFKIEYAIHGPGGSVPRTTSFLFSHFLNWDDIDRVGTAFKQDDSCTTYGDYDYRRYNYIVTNTRGDSTLEVEDTSGCWRTTDFPDGQYWVVVYARDQYGNCTTDSQQVTVNNLGGVAAGPGPAEPGKSSLKAFPSPSRGPVSIRYAVPAPMPVTIRVFNLCGQAVRTLDQGSRTAGNHSVSWDGNIAGGSQAPNGIYVVQLDCPAGRMREKVVIMR